VTMRVQNSSTSSRQALFAEFSSEALQSLVKDPPSHSTNGNALDKTTWKRPLILLTGGIRAPDMMSAALKNNHADLLGVGRLSVVCPDLPLRLRDGFGVAASQPAKQIDAKGSAVEKGAKWLLDNVLYFFSFLHIEPPKVIGAGIETAKYTVLIRNLATSESGTLVHNPLIVTDNVRSIEGIKYVMQMWLWFVPGEWHVGYQISLLCLGIFIGIQLNGVLFT